MVLFYINHSYIIFYKMVEIKAASIYFNKLSAVYCDGEVVSGNIILSISEDISDIKEIRFEAFGISSVFISSSRKPNTNVTKKDTFFSWSKVLSQVKHLVSREFPFEFLLTNEVPSSHVGSHCEIYYGMSVYLKTSMECHLIAMEPFTVLAGLNLSFVPEAAAKIDIFKYKDLGWCCFDEILSVRWRVESSGYISNDIISIRTYAEEDSRHSIKLGDTVLYKVISCKADRKKKIEKVELAKAVTKTTMKKDESLERVEFILVPPNIPVTGSCRSIDISYELEFKAEINGGISRELIANAEVFIGSIPIDLGVMKTYMRSEFSHPRSRFGRMQAIPSAPHEFQPFVGRCSPPPPYITAVKN